MKRRRWINDKLVGLWEFTGVALLRLRNDPVWLHPRHWPKQFWKCGNPMQAAFVRLDGTVEETTVEWFPMDMSPEAVADRERIYAEYLKRTGKLN